MHVPGAICHKDELTLKARLNDRAGVEKFWRQPGPRYETPHAMQKI
jgi:hypothetical protein